MPAQKVDRHSLKILSKMEPSPIPPNNSHQQLMIADDSDSTDTAIPSLTDLSEVKKKPDSARIVSDVTAYEWITVIIIFFINLINYMDRYTVAGVLVDIQRDFEIKDDKAGLLQTVFVISYMLFAPIFGYLGDRYNRKIIIAVGVLIWSLTTLAGSFMDSYLPFLVMRSLVGIGEASYSTVAPTIISDMFVDKLRSIMLAVFYFAIPIGAGLGYIVGAQMAEVTGQWQWGLRVTPILGIVAVGLMMVFMKEPVRGASEGLSHEPSLHNSWLEDVGLLLRNKSFLLSTVGFTCVAFVTGALAWWGPHFIYAGIKLAEGNPRTSFSQVSFRFGVISMMSGLLGVPLGSILAQVLRQRVKRIDPLICGIGLLISAPLIFLAMIFANVTIIPCYVLIFFGEIFLNLNWSIVADMLLYVVPPQRRSTAEALQILISHAFGDAGSPYLIGVVSELLKAYFSKTSETSVLNSVSDPAEITFYGMQYALFITCFVEVLGGVFFLWTALYIIRDREDADVETHGEIFDIVKPPTHLYTDDPRVRR